MVSMRVGQFNTQRLVGLFNIAENSVKQDGYIGAEYLQSDGPFDASQNFRRVNLIGKYKAMLNNADQISRSFSMTKRTETKSDSSSRGLFMVCNQHSIRLLTTKAMI